MTNAFKSLFQNICLSIAWFVGFIRCTKKQECVFENGSVFVVGCATNESPLTGRYILVHTTCLSFIAGEQPFQLHLLFAAINFKVETTHFFQTTRNTRAITDSVLDARTLIRVDLAVACREIVRRLTVNVFSILSGASPSIFAMFLQGVSRRKISIFFVRIP